MPIWNSYQVEEPGICTLTVLLSSLHSSDKLYKGKYITCLVYQGFLGVFSTWKVLTYILTDWLTEYMWMPFLWGHTLAWISAMGSPNSPGIAEGI